ncbi:hypothetical protein BCV69DRAFT_285340 [Microstroma glucosiphilum]|uniref:Signal peptidase subunit 3 n=1 Tax=Pseudomicrostroma glucosiphilum TaxID=1684307 RepID=A0A316U513_9BASI|nr:hypothetical protein BCV69DRAFT_285340 [Pseudomicrostroma glucosiphilum]PWN18045.1 hypothetical protein BCV69DRAFT_285340 [Pseudomicrostroma glucosiphilum]
MAPNQTTLARLQTISGLALTTLLVLTSALAFLTYPSPSVLSNPNPHAALNVSGVEVLLGRNRWHMDRRQQEFLEVRFEGGVDLTGKTDLASFLPESLSGGHQDATRDQTQGKSAGRSLWNWNTKQVFLWLEVEWRDYPKEVEQGQGVGEGRLNRAVVWDRIVRRREDARVVLNGRNKYGVRAEGGKWSKIPSATFTLRWNIMPHVGLLAYGHEASTGSVQIPARVVELDEEEMENRETVWDMPY